jgi:hypothetical protein
MYIKSFLIKLIMTTAVIAIILGLFYAVNSRDVLIISVVLTVIGYIGDVFILPRVGNTLAAMGDFLLATVVIWVTGNVLEIPIAIGTASFISALVLMIGELFLHRFMEGHIFEPQVTNPKHKRGYYQQTNLQTEFAEEVDLDKISKEGNSSE